jgi:DNA invertase Pin-like site-specific DNA recombinase
MPKLSFRRTRCTAVAYLRASKDEQRLSSHAQRTSIESWATREGVRVAAWCTDQGVRSVSPIAERPGLREALAAIREHRAGVLVVARRDRIARDVVLAALVDRAVTTAGARLVSASGEGNGDSPADAFIRTVIDGAAQCEHGLIRARTCAALAVKRARGELLSRSSRSESRSAASSLTSPCRPTRRPPPARVIRPTSPTGTGRLGSSPSASRRRGADGAQRGGGETVTGVEQRTRGRRVR